MSLMLVCSIANAKISADISNRQLKQISRTSIQNIQVLPDTKADIFFNSKTVTNSGIIVPNYSFSITLHANSGYIASPTIKYLNEDLPILEYSIPAQFIGTKTALFREFRSSSPAGTIFEKDGARVTPNGDGSYTIDKNYDTLEKDTPADIDFSYPKKITNYELKTLSEKGLDPITTYRLSENPNPGEDFMTAIKSGNPITLIVTHYPTEIDAVTKTNAQKTSFTIPVAALQEWKTVLEQNGF